MNDDQSSPTKVNHNELVSSFIGGIMVSKGEMVGVCLKFRMYDGSDLLTHWLPDPYKKMMFALDEYNQSLGNQSFMLRAHLNPEIVTALPLRHPYNTLLSEIPTLTEPEIGTTKVSTTVVSAEFVSRGLSFEARPLYNDKRISNIYFHEYTASSMFLYLDDLVKGAIVLSGPTKGNA